MKMHLNFSLKRTYIVRNVEVEEDLGLTFCYQATQSLIHANVAGSLLKWLMVYVAILLCV